MHGNRAVVFDTNSYVYFVKKDWKDPKSELHVDGCAVVAALHEKERARNNIAYASLDVAMELASMMSDPERGVLLPIAKALAGLCEHCGGPGDLRFVAGMTESICVSVFGRNTVHYQANCDAFASAAEDLIAGRYSPLLEELSRNCKTNVEAAKARS